MARIKIEELPVMEDIDARGTTRFCLTGLGDRIREIFEAPQLDEFGELFDSREQLFEEFPTDCQIRKTRVSFGA